MKFKYGDEVKVISGFYEGLEGTVDDFVTNTVSDGDGKHRVNVYYVTINRAMVSIERAIPEEELELLKED